MSTREKIIDGAMAIVRDQGVAHLTLDEAAKVAGVSKGGVLYHFKSKDALIQGMVARVTDLCRSQLGSHYERLPEGPNRWARAAVMSAFDPEGMIADPVGGALLAAVTVNPELIRPFEETYKEMLQLIKGDAADPVLAVMLSLAMDGIWLQDMVGLKLLDAGDRDAIKRRALDLLAAQ